jgi:hypothetical protein
VDAMSSKSKTVAADEDYDLNENRRGIYGFLAGLVVAVFIAFPLSASFAYATHPQTQKLFSGTRLDDASQFGYSLFWWALTLLLLSLPFLVGFGISHLSARTLGVIGGVVAVLIVVVVVLGQLFVFF